MKIKLKRFSIKLLWQFIKFCIVGTSNTLISYIVNIGMLKLLQRYLINKDYMIANFFAFMISVLWSFYWNNKVTFKTKSDKTGMIKMIAKTYMVYAVTGIVLNNIMSYVWIDVLFIPKIVAPLINSAIEAPLNFILTKFLIFTETKQ